MTTIHKRESDTFSMNSGTSKNSDNRRKSRFSLGRLFPRRRPKSAKSRSSIDQLETRSEVSLSGHMDRDITLQSIASSEAIASTMPPSGENGNNAAVECPLCLTQLPDENFPFLMTCHHRSCRDCLRQYLRIEITESRVNICCPECAERFHPNDIRDILNDVNLMNKYEEFMLRRILVSDPDARWCPAPDCGYAVIASGCASCPRLHCERPGCGTSFCYHCKQFWHPNQTCDAARASRSPNLRSASLSYSNDSATQSDIKPCPRCGAFIIKMDDGSCNHMTCAVCGAEFCWLCMKEISDLHYLSPSGCTFWGKKPWSRKKKILWQLGTLVGAPVGISLVAGIAVPAMIIGIPVWVGRKLHAKYEHAPKHKRNLVITGGVTASVLFSPILAGLAVGIGVPILLAYVYGVVPISLCRAGGCGVTTTNTGVRFEFEEEQETNTGVAGPYAGADNHSMETTSHHVTNPSIGPSIGEVSVAMTNSLSASGSHLDRVGILRDAESDRDSASNRAIAGSSLNGSLSGSTAGPSGFHNRLEVHVDVSANASLQKRSSISSESANFSIGEKSATVSFSDDASTKALAGSIAGNRDTKDNVSTSIPPLEVQVDIVSNTATRCQHYNANCQQHKARPSQGSPTSTRSVNFLERDIRGHSAGKAKKYKRQSLSVGDKIHEHMDRANLERLSIKSFNPDVLCVDEDSSREPSPRNMYSLCSALQDNMADLRKSSPHNSASFDSMSSNSRSVSGLPEVESDHPMNYVMLSRSSAFYDAATNNERHLEDILNDNVATTTTPTSADPNCNDNDNEHRGYLLQRSRSESVQRSQSPLLDIEGDSLSLGHRPRQRRVSCEMAIEHGRLSPQTMREACDV